MEGKGVVWNKDEGEGEEEDKRERICTVQAASGPLCLPCKWCTGGGEANLFILLNFYFVFIGFLIGNLACWIPA